MSRWRSRGADGSGSCCGRAVTAVLAIYTGERIAAIAGLIVTMGLVGPCVAVLFRRGRGEPDAARALKLTALPAEDVREADDTARGSR